MAYSDKNDFSSMQEEAIKRVREMQRRSRSVTAEESHIPPPPPLHKEPQQSTRNAVNSLLGGLLGNRSDANKDGELFNIAGIKIDEEKALIGMLIYVLYKNGADIKLLLGLGYLLL